MSKLTWCVLLAVAAFGCRRNDNFCEGANPNNNCSEIDAAIDSPMACTSSAECTPPLGVCDVTGSMTCVQCTPGEDDACMAQTPVCGDAEACRACAAHIECAGSNACLPDGSCAAAGQVAYVDPSGTDNVSCTVGTPCTVVAKALATGRPYVKFTGTTDEQVPTLDNQSVTFLASPGAKLTSTSNGRILEIRGTSQVAIFDLEISGASGAQGYGILIPTGGGAPTLSLTGAKIDNNQGGGISSSGGTVTVTQSTVSGNTGAGISSSGGTVTVTQSTVSGNTGGGISIMSALFDLTNNIIVKNGSGTSFFGGVNLAQVSANGTHKLDFNTISANLGPATVNTGITCSNVLTSLTFSSNIVYANIVTGGGTQAGGSANCGLRFSDVGPDTVSGTGNINMDPMFVNAAQDDFHLTANSPAKDVADPTATLSIDVDGDSRPQGGGRDIGADEHIP